jgi:folate-binding protein YgfZ
MTTPTELPDDPAGYAQIVVTGTDAISFLQGQLTNDLRRLEREPRLLAAWCNPKGRVIALLRVARDADRLLLALPAELADAVVRRLTTFRFRARVDFATEPAASRVLAGSDAADFDLAAWRRANLENGVAEIAAAQSEQFTPHMLNLDLLGALSLDKGCYTGQEIVARTHYRGATRRRTLRFRASRPVSPGDAIYADANKIGEVVNAIDDALLAVVDLAAVASAESELSCGDARLVRESLPYSFD